ncbi:MAG: bifunctional hydroxymethylpyrimidine kinase/phosphomethylpyrimidine kinase [Alphaproteobacteria bacterium]|nr:bifunctional hydroxymethylpyrimidine kinase/phosphomethylpyrimidine kinase [Alphaproteobacteria bacterium]MBF0130368.1 bifunctional hydroxymethylpyrimidine kinase/phosphomethylpyrimidine kinase [Alphaproteobacteria bacterium]
MKGRVLIVAGSDCSGGAGIQADIKTVTALGGYAMTAITALTAQNTRGVAGVLDVPPDFVARQMVLCLEDIGADAVKTGMLASVPVIEAVADVLDGRDVALVVDPVMVAKGGASLLDPGAAEVLIRRLFPRAALVTPNLPEAEALLGGRIPDADAMTDAALRLLALGPRAVLLKGGHLDGDRLVDVLAARDFVHRFETRRIVSTSTHGTGCTLASALATGLAQGMGLVNAVARARAYVVEAIRTAPGLGHGHGPLNHCHPLGRFPA